MQTAEKNGIILNFNFENQTKTGLAFTSSQSNVNEKANFKEKSVKNTSKVNYG